MKTMKKNSLAKIASFLPVAVPLAVLLLAGAARAEFPEKPITMLIAFDPGSGTDIIARMIAMSAEKELGQRIAPENRAGAAGTVALALLANAKPDGYTICCAPSDSVVYTPLVQKVTFKPLTSFTPIIGIALAANTALIVRPDSPWKTAQEFIGYAKKNPGKIKYSSSGVGTGMHVAMEYIAAKENIKWVHIPYKGTAQARIALVGGHVDACSAGAEFAQFALQGQVRVLATHGATRSPEFPDVPTLKELGYDFVKETIFALFAPAGLAPDVLKKLETAFTKAMEAPEFKATIEKLDCTKAYYNAKDYDRYLKELWPRAEKVFKEARVIKEPATQPY